MTQGSNLASAEQIEREIAATRSEIDATLATIQDKLSPGQVLDSALGYLQRNGGEFAGNMGRSVRDNPVPMVLVGLGLSWLMFADSRGRADADLEEAGSGDSRDDIEQTRDFATGESDRPSGASQTVKSRTSRMMSAGQNRLQGAGETVQHYGDSARRTYEEARAGAADFARQAAEGVHGAQQSASRFMNDHPLVIGAFAVAAGAMIAALMPTTRREGEIMGQGAKRTRNAVSEGAEATLESAKKVAQAARAGVKTGAEKDDGLSEGGDGASHGDDGPRVAERGSH